MSTTPISTTTAAPAPMPMPGSGTTTTPTMQPSTHGHAQHTVTITLPDGSTFDHTAEALAYRHEADGSIAVTAACCGMYGGTLCGDCNGAGCGHCNDKGSFAIKGIENTLSRHTFYDIGMPTSDGNGGILPPIDPAAEVQKHVQAVAERHAARHKAKASGLDGLMKPKPPAAPTSAE